MGPTGLGSTARLRDAAIKLPPSAGEVPRSHLIVAYRYPAACRLNSSAYNPPRATSSSCVP